MIERPRGALPLAGCEVILARGPFAAARDLKLPVVMIEARLS